MKKIKFGRDFYEKMKTVDEFAKAYDADKFHIDLQWILEVCPIRFDLIKYIQATGKQSFFVEYRNQLIESISMMKKILKM